MATKKFEKQVVSIYKESDNNDLPVIVEDVRLEGKSLHAAKLAAAKLQKQYNLEPTADWIYLDFLNDYKRLYVDNNGIGYTIFIHHFQENNVPNNGDVN